MTNYQITCPNCTKTAHRAYTQGYSDAVKSFEKIMIDVQAGRPIVIEAPKGSIIIDEEVKE